MKHNNTKLYARALSEVILKGVKPADEEKVVKNFLKLLVKNGQEKKVKEILNLTEDIVLAKKGKKKITFETARKITASQKNMLYDFAKEGDIIKEKISPEIIAGVKIIINGSKQFDASLQSKLSHFVRSVVDRQN